MAAARTAPSAMSATCAGMNTADATAMVAVTSNAATWVSASIISFGDVAAAAGADIAAAALVCWRLPVGIGDEAFEPPGNNASEPWGTVSP